MSWEVSGKTRFSPGSGKSRLLLKIDQNLKRFISHFIINSSHFIEFKVEMDGHPVIDIVLPTYRMEPEENERFYPSKAKQIAEKIIADELNGVTYDEEDAKNWSLNISDKVREAVHGKIISCHLHSILLI